MTACGQGDRTTTIAARRIWPPPQPMALATRPFSTQCGAQKKMTSASGTSQMNRYATAQGTSQMNRYATAQGTSQMNKYATLEYRGLNTIKHLMEGKKKTTQGTKSKDIAPSMVASTTHHQLCGAGKGRNKEARSEAWVYIEARQYPVLVRNPFLRSHQTELPHPLGQGRRPPK